MQTFPPKSPASRKLTSPTPPRLSIGVGRGALYAFLVGTLFILLLVNPLLLTDPQAPWTTIPILAASQPAPTSPQNTPLKTPQIPQLEKHLQRIAKAKNIQTELPLPDEPEPYQDTNSSGLAMQIAKIIVILVALIGAFLLVAILIRSWRFRAMKITDGIIPSSVTPPLAPLKQALVAIGQDADKLAAEGFYAEAIHALLLKSLEEYKKRETRRMRPSHTSRELLTVLPLSSVEDEALRDLVRRVEITYFGPITPTLSDYEKTKTSYGRLIAAISAPKTFGAHP